MLWGMAATGKNWSTTYTGGDTQVPTGDFSQVNHIRIQPETGYRFVHMIWVHKSLPGAYTV